MTDHIRSESDRGNFTGMVILDLQEAFDTVDHQSGKDVSQIQATLSKELESIREWLIDNKLSQHLGKTESIIFGTNKTLQLAPQLNIECAGNKLANRSSVKYLGVDLDQTLSGEIISKKLVSKINGKLSFLYRNTKSFNLETKKLLVSALIQCRFDYASSCWYSGLTKYFKSKIQITQNKVIRYLLNLTLQGPILVPWSLGKST